MKLKEETMQKVIDNFGLHGVILIMAVVIGMMRMV